MQDNGFRLVWGRGICEERQARVNKPWLDGPRAMWGLRFSSPFAWLAAAFLFYLPWVDIRCQGRDGREVRGTFSGAQIAWGGATWEGEGEGSTWKLADLSELREYARQPGQLLVPCLLTAYLLTLAAGLCFVCTRPPSTRRALIGAAIALVALGLLLGGCWIVFGDPFRLEPPSQPQRGRSESRFTFWYYASYLACGWALGSFVVEYRHVRGPRSPHDDVSLHGPGSS
jgi:hypothetical protein